MEQGQLLVSADGGDMKRVRKDGISALDISKCLFKLDGKQNRSKGYGDHICDRFSHVYACGGI